jgi:N-acetylmuramoyl-L-alanine amidase
MIIIDAGHGGRDPGACANGIKEKDWTLEVSLYQYQRLQELGIPVLLTRKDDRTLEPTNRAKIVKTSGAKVCISNHFNAGGGSGSEIIHSIYGNSQLANDIAREIEGEGMHVRRVYSKSGQAGKDFYYMHRLTGSVETLIVEYGFIDNKSDFNILRSKLNRLKYAEAVIRALCNWMNHPYNEERDKKKQLYFVQVGAFEKEENAEKLVKRLKKDGYPAIIKQ